MSVSVMVLKSYRDSSSDTEAHVVQAFSYKRRFVVTGEMMRNLVRGMYYSPEMLAPGVTSFINAARAKSKQPVGYDANGAPCEDFAELMRDDVSLAGELT